MSRLTLTLTAIAVLLLSAARALAHGPGLHYSTASSSVVQRQPAAGSCHALGRGLYSRPDPRCTPGALNPRVTQATIAHTICRAGWTASVRPPETVTEAEKLASMAAYGDAGSAHGYEYDHFVPLELGGAANDPRNLWPEPGGSPNPKDRVENELNRAVCDGQMTLAQAQREIVADWVALARRPARPAPGPVQRTEGSVPTSRAWCTAIAAYSSYYHDYDVYVRSNQRDQSVSVTGAGQTASWHTDASGYADVYFHAGPAAAGDRVTVEAGAASCSTTL